MGLNRLASVLVFVLFILSPVLANASENFWQGKVILVNQYSQQIFAYENGVEIRHFPCLTGDAVLKTPQGFYLVEKKDPRYWSKKYATRMPYSLFFLFDNKNRMAIHAGVVPEKELARKKATHGCVHAKDSDAKWLFEWADEFTTKIIIYGDRSRD